MATSQELLIVIDAATEQLRRELKQADTAVAQSSSKMERSLTKVDAAFAKLNTGASAAAAGVSRAMGALGVALGGAAIIQGMDAAINRIDQIKRTADAVGTSTQSVQELSYAFQQFGLDTEDVSDALNTLADRAQDALAGTQSMIDDFALIGISVDDLRNKDPAELFELFADAIARTTDTAQRNTAAVRNLGDDLGNRLLPLLRQGSAGLDAFKRRAHELGIVLSDEAVAGSTRAAQALRDLKTVLAATFTNMVGNNADALADALERLVDAIADPGTQKAVQDFATEAMNFAADMVEGVRALHQALEDLKNFDFDALALGLGKRLIDRGSIFGFAFHRKHEGVELTDQIASVLSGKGSLIDKETAAAAEPTLPATVVQAKRLPAKEDTEPKEDAAALAADQRRAAQIIEATRTPLEQYRAGVAEAQRLFERGQLSAEQFQRQMRVVKSEFDRALEGFSVDSERLIPGLGTPEEARAKAQAISEEVRTPLEALQAELARTQQLFDQGFLPEEDWRRKTAALQQQIDALAPGMRLITGLADDFGAAVAGAFEQAVADGDNLRGVVRGLAQDLQRLVLRQTVTQPLAGFVSSFISGAAASAFGGGGAAAGGGSLQATGGLTAALGSALPARAEGGPVLAGRAYLVGERGPEPFIPAVNGTILPNRALGGVRINAPISIHAPNADRQAVVEIARIAQQLPALVVSTITQDVARDGPISRSLRR